MRRALGLAACALSAVGLRVGSAQDSLTPAAPIIDSIAIISRNVFDPEEAQASFLFRLMNGYHIRTQHYVLRQEFLFRQGEPYDSAKAAETERNLRALGLFREVIVDTVTVDGRLVLRVNAADAWTTTVQMEAKSTGGDFEWGLGLKEKNLIGTATLGRVKFRDKVDRKELTVEGEQNRLFTTQVAAHVRYDFLSDGDKGGWTIGDPFRSFADPFSLELPGAQALRRELQFRDGRLDQEYWHRLFRQNLRIAYAPIADERRYLRVGLEGFVKRDEYILLADTANAVPDTVRAAVSVFAEFAKARFKVTRYYLAFRRAVDVDLSTRVRLGLWAAPTLFGYDRNGVGPALQFQVGAPFGPHFAKFRVAANALFNSAGLDSGQVHVNFDLVLQAIPKSATVIHVEAGVQDGAPPGGEIDLGLGEGPRAFKAHAFTGTRSLWGTIEQRFFVVDEFLNLFGLGFAGYFDYGGAWYPDQPVRMGGDVGFGLRLSSVRAGEATVGRLDLSYRFGDGFDGSRWVFSFGRVLEF